MEKIWADLVQSCDELGQVHWDWQSADGCMGKARHGGDRVGKNPTDRGKNGTKRSLVVDEQGGPLGMAIDGANRHDAKLLKATLEAIVVPRPNPEVREQHLCLDKGYDNPSGREAARASTARRIGSGKVAQASTTRVSSGSEFRTVVHAVVHVAGSIVVLVSHIRGDFASVLATPREHEGGVITSMTRIALPEFIGITYLPITTCEIF
jgi:hypothetical protein